MAFVMHKTETDPVKVGMLLWRNQNDPGSIPPEQRKCLLIVGGNHSHAANLLALKIQQMNDNFKGMTCRCFAAIKWYDSKTGKTIEEGMKQINCVSYVEIYYYVSLNMFLLFLMLFLLYSRSFYY